MSGLTVVRSFSELEGARGEIRAGGTDLHDRLRSGIFEGPVLDIHALPDLDRIERFPDGALRIGALVSVARLAASREIAAAHAGLSRTAAGLATPQIRSAATFGGALLQRTRCAYYRTPGLSCTRKGDPRCGARDGVHANGVLFDRGGCAHPHPSSLGMALLVYGATVDTTRREGLPVADLYGDGSDPARDHLLEPGEVLTHVSLPALPAGERSAYFRAISRHEAEWPIVETLVRLRMDGERITEASVGAGAVAQVPLLLPQVASALVGQVPRDETLAAASGRAAEGANPLPQAAWKTRMLTGSVLSALERALA